MDYTNKTLDGNCQQLTMYTNKCYNEYAPFTNSDYTYLKITNPHHDVNLINQNFINVEAQIDITPKRDLTFRTEYYKEGTTVDDINNSADVESLIDHTTYGDLGKKLYIGWKNSGEIIEEMTVYNNGNETGFQQVHADRENYLESTKYITATEKDLHRNCHFTYYNYKENLEDEVPGVIWPEEKMSWIDKHTKGKTYNFKGSLVSHQIKPLTDRLLIEFPHLNLTVGTWCIISESDFKILLYKIRVNSILSKEWTDFIFDYDYVQNDSNKFLAMEKDGTGLITVPFDTIDELATYLKDNSDYIPVTNPDVDFEEYIFVEYITYSWLTNDGMQINIPLVIQLKDIPAFNSIDYFERPFGDITLKLMLGPRSLMIFTEIEKCKQYASSEFDISNFQINLLTCECYGYSVINDGISTPDEIWAPIRSKFGRDSDKSRIYESRFTVFKNFDGNIEGGRFHIQFPGQLEMVKDIHMVFPRNTTDYTVFRNPFLEAVKLKLDGVLYPREENIRTDNRMFYHMQAKNFELDDDVKYSYTCPALNSDETGPLEDEDKKPELDDSNFILTYNLAVGHFMALHKYADNVNIFFTAEIIHYLQDMYGVNASGDDDAGNPIPIQYTDTEPSPQIWFTHDACWKLNLRDGLTFMYKTCPSFDLYNNDKEDIFYMKQGN